MKICLVGTFPPSGRQLNEYAFHLAGALGRNPGVELTILADEVTNYGFVTDEAGRPINVLEKPELPGFDVIRCWRFGDMSSPIRILQTVRRVNPDVVWFNLVFSTFATPDMPVAAFIGLSGPAFTRAAGFYTHVTLHQLLEHVDLQGAGVRGGRLMRLGANLATRTLLNANSVSVLLPCYYSTLLSKYSARNVLLGTHGTFSAEPCPPDFSKRDNPEQRILAIGHWGTYKRLETLMEAFPLVLDRVPRARLIVAGSNHHTRPGYWESIRAALPSGLPVEFRGYVPEDEIAGLFITASIVVLPYDSATGSSGPAHLACDYGVPIVSAALPDFVAMAENENMAIRFYQGGDAAGLADQLVTILESSRLEREMAEQNYAAGLEMTMSNVVANYLRWFELNRLRESLSLRDSPARRRSGLGSARGEAASSDLGLPTP